MVNTPQRLPSPNEPGPDLVFDARRHGEAPPYRAVQRRSHESGAGFNTHTASQQCDGTVMEHSARDACHSEGNQRDSADEMYDNPDRMAAHRGQLIARGKRGGRSPPADVGLARGSEALQRMRGTQSKMQIPVNGSGSAAEVL